VGAYFKKGSLKAERKVDILFAREGQAIDVRAQKREVCLAFPWEVSLPKEGFVV